MACVDSSSESGPPILKRALRRLRVSLPLDHVMTLPRLALLLVVGFAVASCSDKHASARRKKLTTESNSAERGTAPHAVASHDRATEMAEPDAKPDADQIGEDCVAFLRSTTVVTPIRAAGECPQCPVGEAPAEVLKFRDLDIERVSTSGQVCEVIVRLRGSFNRSIGGAISGGLVGWIDPEQRAAYARGETPAGPQVFRVHVTYRRTDKGWRAIEFARADAN